MRAPNVIGLAVLVALAGCNSAPADLAAPPDGSVVLEQARTLVTLPDGGPWYRTPGTVGNLEQARLLRDSLASEGFAARLDHFNATLPLTGPTWCRNVVADREGTMVPERSVDFRRPLVVLAAHFDSRARADKDPDAAKRDHPVLGANDGASGVAVVLGILRALPPTRSDLRVYFFDCEDQGDGGRGWAVGAAHAAEVLDARDPPAITAFILFDLVGDAELVVPREGYSHAYAARLLDTAFGLAEEHDLSRFENRTSIAVTDDHLPFLAKGVPAIDLIHLDRSPDGDPFPSTHHTTFDDADHLSADALGQAAALGFRLVRHLDQKVI